MSDKPKVLSIAQRVEILSRLREARARVLRDAESFQEAATVLEYIGQIVGGRIERGLRCYENAALSVIQETAANRMEEARKLFNVVREARNMAVHEGTWARNLNTRLVDLFLILEEAIISDMKLAEDLMVRNPQVAEPWHLVAHVRRTMLANSFSTLPIRIEFATSYQWSIITDTALLKFTKGTSFESREQDRLSMTIADATKNGLELEPAKCRRPKAVIASILPDLNHLPILITDSISGEERLLGMITSFDLL